VIGFSGQAVSSPLSHIFRIFRLARGTHSHVGVIVVCDDFSKLLKIIVRAAAEKRCEVKRVSVTPKPDMYFGRRKRYTLA
jgi:hypothetical protein